MGNDKLIARLENHQCGCGGSCGQQTPAYIRDAAAALKAAEAKNCAWCGGSGLIDAPMPKDPGYDDVGRVVPCPKCDGSVTAADANLEFLKRENEEFRQQIIDLQNQMMKERGYLAAARAEVERLKEGLRKAREASMGNEALIAELLDDAENIGHSDPDIYPCGSLMRAAAALKAAAEWNRLRAEDIITLGSEVGTLEVALKAAEERAHYAEGTAAANIDRANDMESLVNQMRQAGRREEIAHALAEKAEADLAKAEATIASLKAALALSCIDARAEVDMNGMPLDCARAREAEADLAAARARIAELEAGLLPFALAAAYGGVPPAKAWGNAREVLNREDSDD